MKRVLSFAVAIALIISAVIMMPETAHATTVAYVKGGWLRLRAAPSFDSETLASYYTGTAVTVLSAAGSWYYVQTGDSRIGYMYGSYLSFTPSPTPSGDTKGVVYAANGRDVRLRSGPGTNYGVIGSYSVGTSVTILSAGSAWHYIKVGKQKGYMMAQYISTSSTPSPVPPTPSGGYTAYVYASNGKKVNLRTGPGTNYPSMGLYKVGTLLTVLSHGATWDYVQIGTATGYMMTKFITTSYNPPTPTKVVIASAQLSSTSPHVGETLSVLVNPGTATYSCQWYNNYGVLLANTNTYKVQDKDLGYSLMASVSGVGSTTGTAVTGYSSPVTYGTPVSKQLTAVTVSNLNPTVNQTLTASAQPAGATAVYMWYRSDGSTAGSGANYTVTAADTGYRLYCVATGSGEYTGTVSSGYTNPVTGGTVTQPLSGSVSLPNATTPGVTLTPTMVLNTYAVNYSWQQNGVVVGTGSSLYVSETMVGDDLRLTVTAQPGSGYEGSLSSGYCYVQTVH